MLPLIITILVCTTAMQRETVDKSLHYSEPFQIGYYYENMDKPDSAILYYKKSHPLLWEHALFRMGCCSRKLEKYREATIYYELVLKYYPEFVYTDSAMQELSKCYEKLGEHEEVLPQKAISIRKNSNKDSAIFMNATLLEELGKKEEAISKYNEIHTSSTFYELSNIRKGLLAMELGNDSVAIEAFKHISPPASYYWSHKVYVNDGKEDSAKICTQNLLKDYPLSYYAWRLGSKDGISEIEPELWISEHSDTSYTLSSTDKRRLERSKLLLELEIPEIAIDEIDAIRETNPIFIWRLIELFDSHGLNNCAIRYGKKIKLRGELPRKVASLIYPQSFMSIVNEVAGTVDGFLLLAIIREESYFNPKAVSTSNAIGLTQILPSTGNSIARKLKVDNFDLFDPYTNIQFGSYYLSYYFDSFDGKPELALAAYNGGPTRVAEWIAKGDTSKLDVWVERIPRDQTREYVKKVLSSYLVYQLLWKQ